MNAPLLDAPVSDLDPAEQTLRYYEYLVASSARMLANVVAMIAAVAGQPVLLHCAAGKDRTGVVSALLLSLLGVGREAIVDDYMASGHSMPRMIERFREWPRYAEHMATVPPELYQADERTIRGFLRHLDERYDGAPGWARSSGLPDDLLARLRTALLRPGP
jgi:protein-tyrosine phosphatase